LDRIFGVMGYPQGILTFCWRSDILWKKTAYFYIYNSVNYVITPDNCRAQVIKSTLFSWAANWHNCKHFLSCGQAGPLHVLRNVYRMSGCVVSLIRTLNRRSCLPTLD
jgi:hypothetical protein